MPRPRTWVLVAAALALFGVWSNSFIAIGYLLGNDGAAPRFDWVELTVARFLPASALCSLWCLVFRRREVAEIARRHPVRLAACAFFAVPGYNFALYYGQQDGIPAPVASLITTLVMVLAALFLGERPGPRRIAGFLVAAAGMAVLGSSEGGAGGTYTRLVAITALAPASWSVYSVLSKPMAGRVSPILWTYLATAIGGWMVAPLVPFGAWQGLQRLDGRGWAALLYLSIPCTVLGFAVWTWLLRYLPASTVGFTVFLNPPLTTVSKWTLAAVAPATFAFTLDAAEWLGGAIVLGGVVLAVYRAHGPRSSPRT